MKNETTAHGARRILIGRIENLAIGPADANLGFEGRLAAENGWSSGHARMVATEYRRFIAIAAISGEEVTPSDAVDQAWHLHMVYTRSYWQDLCRDILGRELHHDPTSGGCERREHYRDRYARTLELYREFFGEDPPEAVWPVPERRFLDCFVRVDTGRNVVVTSSRVMTAAMAMGGFALLEIVGAGVLAAAAALVIGVFAVFHSAALAAGPQPPSKSSGSSGSDGGGCGGDAGSCGDGGCGSGCGGGCGCG